jgi:hypothetical protein
MKKFRNLGHYMTRNITVSTCHKLLLWSWDRSVGIATSYGLDSQGFIPGWSKRYFLLHSAHTGSGAHPDFYPMGTGGSSPRGQSGLGIKLITQIHLVPRSRMVELYLHCRYVFMA